MADNHNVPHFVYYALKTSSDVIFTFLDPENIYLDTSFAVLCGKIKILGRITCFGIMAASNGACSQR